MGTVPVAQNRLAVKASPGTGIGRRISAPTWANSPDSALKQGGVWSPFIGEQSERMVWWPLPRPGRSGSTAVVAIHLPS